MDKINMDDEVRLFEAMATIHEMSMSDQPDEAVAGRFLKRFFEQFEQFERDEISRGTHKGLIIAGMAHAMAASLGVSAYAYIKSGKEEFAKRELIKLMTLVIDGVFDAQKGTRVERSKRGQSSALDSH